MSTTVDASEVRCAIAPVPPAAEISRPAEVRRVLASMGPDAVGKLAAADSGMRLVLQVGSFLEVANARALAGPLAGAQLRRLYIDGNPYPEGDRDNFELAADGSRYSQVHAYYHYWLRTFLLHRSLYDVLLLDRFVPHRVQRW